MFNQSRMWGITPISILICGLLFLAACSEQDTPNDLAGPDKVSIGTEPDPDELVSTRILDGETDPLAPGEDQLYPYYIVHHGPAAGTYPFESGDTVPDGATVVFKAVASSEEPAPQKLHLQGRFQAEANLENGAVFSFFTTYSDGYLNPGWRDLTAASDTISFEVGPYDYTMNMRGVLFQQGEVAARDETPAEFIFHGNHAPCVQCIELGGLGMTPNALYDDLAGDTCDDPACLGQSAELSIYANMDPRYQSGDDDVLIGRGFAPQMGSVWVNPELGQISLEEPWSGEWTAIQCYEYFMKVSLHGKDPVTEAPRAGFMNERIKGWRYQVDYAGDPENVLADGPGRDNIHLVTDVEIFDNPQNPDPQIHDLFIDNDTGVWGMMVKVSVPIFLMLGGEDLYWNMLQQQFACPPFPDGGTEDEILAWQADPAVQDAYRTWQLTTIQFTEGSIRAVALDMPRCDSNPMRGKYHYFDGTRVPRDPFSHGRSCEDGAYDGNEEGIVELGALELDSIHSYRPTDEAARSFHIDVYANGHEQPLDLAAPPGWLATMGKPLTGRYDVSTNR